MGLPIPFNNPRTYNGHSGVDFPQSRGTIFRASGPGIVTALTYGARPGHTVWVKYDNGPLVGYCHMDKPTTLVAKGTRVSEGTPLGIVGSLGANSTGPHLHVEVDGFASTAGFWRFFDANRVVGSGAPAGNGMLVVDGDWGAATTSKLQSVLGVAQDGALGPITIKALQARLSVEQDGKMGPITISALQAKVGATVDGALGPNTVKALQTYLNNGGTFAADTNKLTVDGNWGPATTKAFQKSLNVIQDGVLGPISWTAFQNAVGITADGQPGPQTYKALQMNVGATVDGALGPQTVTKLQEHLNAGKGWSKVTLPTESPLPPYPAVAVRTSEYPGAARSWTVPLSFRLNDAKTAWVPDTRTGGKITGLVLHHTTNLGDEEPFFKTANSRGSCPTGYIAGGQYIGFIPLTLRPSSTGDGVNEFTVALEIQNTKGEPNWETSEENLERTADYAAWLASKNGQNITIDGVTVRVEFTLDRDHIFGDREATAKTGIQVRPTACPGPFIMSRMDWIVERAKVLLATKYAPTKPEPEVPPVDTVPVKKELLARLRAVVGELP